MTNHVSGAAVKGKTMIFQPFLAVLIALHHINEELTFMLSLLVLFDVKCGLFVNTAGGTEWLSGLGTTG